jgi:hypothetical protein
MGRACSTNGGKAGIHIVYWWKNQKEIDHWADQEVDRWTILKWILERYNAMV